MEERKQAFVLFGYRFFYVLLLSALFYLALWQQLRFRETAALHFFILAVLSAGISAVDSMKGRNYLYGFIALVSVFALIVLVMRDSPEGEGGAPGRVFFREMLWLMLIVLGVYLCQLLMERFLWVKRASALLVLAVIVAGMVCKWQIPHLGVAAAMLYGAAVLTEYIESGWKKRKQGSEAAYLLWLLPFLAVYFVLTAAMPYRDTPYDWALFVNLYGRIQEKVIAFTESVIRFGQEDFGLSTTGFAEEGGFFGNLERKDRVVMVIDNPYRYEGDIYLTGMVFDTFDGRQWSREGYGAEKPSQAGKTAPTAARTAGDCELDTLTTLNAVYRYDGDYPGDYLRERTIGVEYRHFHTGCLFAPLKTGEIKLAGRGAEFGQQAGSYLFAKKQGYGTSYRLSYYQLNQGNPIFEEFILSGSGDAMQGDDRPAGGRLQSGEAITWRKLADYQERMRREYLQDAELGPEAEAFLREAELDPEAETFLREAAAGADSVYGKLLRLESALSGLAYNERPGRLPKDVDTPEKFLDYFLADSREGYCSYFASAFVLLARREGFPARYVQGFLVPLDGRSTIEVTDGMAHAWPEVWLDGIGWIPFEPTPGFGGRISWAPHVKKEQTGEDEAGRTEAARELWDSVFGKSDEEPEEDAELLLREAERAKRMELLRFLGYFLVMLLFLGALLLTADALLERRRASRRSPMESFRLEALRGLQVLAALGYCRQESETLAELGERLGSGAEARAGRDFIAICEEVLYGNLDPDGEILEKTRLAYKSFLEQLKEKKGKSYWLNRIGLYLMRAR